MFSNAKKLPATPAPAKGKAAAKVTTMLPGLAEVAALDACAKAIKGLLETKKAALKDAATEILIERGLERHARPDTLPLAEGDYATGRATITRRATTSPLSQDELAVLAEHLDAEVERDEDGNITSIEQFAETHETHAARLAVNEAYINDEALLKRIDKALSGVKGIPEDFIGWTAPESRIVVSETAPDAVFKLDPDVVAMVLPMVTGTTLGTAFKDVSAAWEIVKPMLAPDPAEAKKAVKTMLRAALIKEVGV